MKEMLRDVEDRKKRSSIVLLEAVARASLRTLLEI